MSSADRLLVCEATLLLALAGLIVVMLPFGRLASWLARAPEKSGTADEVLLLRTRKAVTAAARNVPWNAVCLPQAIAAKVILGAAWLRFVVSPGRGFRRQGQVDRPRLAGGGRHGRCGRGRHSQRDPACAFWLIIGYE